MNAPRSKAVYMPATRPTRQKRQLALATRRPSIHATEFFLHLELESGPDLLWSHSLDRSEVEFSAPPSQGSYSGKLHF